MTGPTDLTWVHYLPAATTAVAAAFSLSLFRERTCAIRPVARLATPVRPDHR